MTDQILDLLNEDEWEMLCDGCGLCCLYKVQDEDTGELFYTSIVCPLLDRDTARCTAYAERFDKMPSCTKISSDNIRKIARWLPKNCAYRCLLEGLALPDWHPLNLDGSPEADALRKKISGVCVRPNTCISKETVDRILKNSRAPRSFHKLNRLLLDHVIEDQDI